MNKKKQDENVKTIGITFNNINLIECEFKTAPSYKKKELIPPNVHAEYAHNKVKSKKNSYNLVCFMKFYLKNSGDDAPFSLFLFYQWDYSYTKDCKINIDQFAKKTAPAHAITYIREMVSNITNRSVYPVLNMPLINIEKLIEDSTTDLSKLKDKKKTARKKRLTGKSSKKKRTSKKSN